jgi:RNA 2',3'-cyclic 3'-phosphodiesterase
MATLRTFIAIELDEDLKDNLARLQNRLRGEMSPRSVRWVRPEGIHLTLKFLGDTTTEQVDQVKEALVRAATGAGPITFSVGGVGCFPNTRRPRVVWVGLHEPAGALARLRDAVEEQVAPLGFPTEKRPFSPHLTLGRVHRNASRSEVGEVGEVVATSAIGDIDEMTATALSYIQSELKPSGAVYTTLARAEFGA